VERRRQRKVLEVGRSYNQDLHSKNTSREIRKTWINYASQGKVERKGAHVNFVFPKTLIRVGIQQTLKTLFMFVTFRKIIVIFMGKIRRWMVGTIKTGIRQRRSIRKDRLRVIVFLMKKKEVSWER